MVLAHPQVRDAASLVAAVEAMPPHEVARALLNRTHDAPEPGLEADVERALGGDREAIAAVEARMTSLGEGHALAPLRAILRDPVGTTERLHLALRAWLEPFQSVEERVSGYWSGTSPRGRRISRGPRPNSSSGPPGASASWPIPRCGR